MRVIAGEFRSRKILSIPGEVTRPTSDRLRETLFDILGPRVERTTFVDAYAGTGAVGIEALSRGATLVYFLERDKVALETIRENLASLRVGSRAMVVAGPVARTLERCSKAEIVFADPPYELEAEYTTVLERLAAAPPALAIVQHSFRFKLPDEKGVLHRTRLLKQGENALSFYVPQATEA
jgi:16S rRNA (guanine966-N2)-methyltransferase